MSSTNVAYPWQNFLHLQTSIDIQWCSWMSVKGNGFSEKQCISMLDIDCCAWKSMGRIIDIYGCFKSTDTDVWICPAFFRSRLMSTGFHGHHRAEQRICVIETAGWPRHHRTQRDQAISSDRSHGQYGGLEVPTSLPLKVSKSSTAKANTTIVRAFDASLTHVAPIPELLHLFICVRPVRVHFDT